MNAIKHASMTSWNREFYSVEVKESGELSVTTRTLNIFQRILRFLFGAYKSTILTQKKYEQLLLDHPEQTDKVKDLALKVNGLGKNIINKEGNTPKVEEDDTLISEEDNTSVSEEVLPEKDEKIHNILLVGRSRGGKTTMMEMMKDPFHIAKEACSLFASTREPALTEIELNGHTFRILDTPGLCETWPNEEKRTNKHIATLIQKKASEVFGGKKFENVDSVIMTFSVDEGINQADVTAMNHFLPKLPLETKKIMVITRSERFSDKDKMNIRNDLSDYPGTAKAIKDHFGGKGDILFTGAFPEFYLDSLSTIKSDILKNINSGRERLFDALLFPSMTAVERKPYTKERLKALADGFEEFDKIRKAE